jgi:hypothetical protein
MRNKKVGVAMLFVAITLVLFFACLKWTEFVVAPKLRSGILSTLKGRDSVTFRNEQINEKLICGEVNFGTNDDGHPGYKRYISTPLAHTVDGDGQSTLGNAEKSSEDVLEEFDWKLQERKSALKLRETLQQTEVITETLNLVPSDEAVSAWRFNRLWKKYCVSALSPAVS